MKNMDANMAARYEHEIPEGYEARIEGNKVIIELKESEDERIRTRLIALVEAFGQGEYKNEMLAYLEKQKEQKPIENIELEKEIKNWSFGLAGHDAEDWAGPTARYFFKLGQDSIKPAEWSEEDENALEFLHELISFGFTEKFFDAQTAADMRKWLNTRLKSLRPQPHWKPSQEQMEALRAAMEHNVCYCGCNQHALKSLYYDLQKLL